MTTVPSLPALRATEFARLDATGTVYRACGLGLEHKHVPEMQRYGLLEVAPYFRPSVGAFERGMRVEIPLLAAHNSGAVDARAITDAYERHYQSERFVRVDPR